jgi:hypothetical protein
VCLESYLENCVSHGRSPEFVVMDDSRSAGSVDLTKIALRQLARRFDRPVRYAARRQRDRFADTLAAESGVSPEIIRFAMFGDERCALSTGANRNCLLLDTLGSLTLAVDDDTLCRIASAPDPKDGVAFFPGYEPTEFWFFSSRDRAIQSATFVDVDVLACHEALLGRALADLGGPATASGAVTMTLNGLLGDSGMTSPRYYLTLTSASRDRLVASPEAYRSAFQSREILRCARQPTITAGPFCMTTFLGLDNRLLLPPFFPVQRNSDGIFGHVARKCLDGSHVAFLPWALLHAPEPPRVFRPDDLWSDVAAVRIADIIIAGVLGHEPRTGNVATAMRLVDIGKHLRSLGSLSESDFEEYLLSVQNFCNFGFITALHSQLQTYGTSPGFWAEDVSRMIKLISAEPSPPQDGLVPLDLRNSRDEQEAGNLGQELVRKFGELLEAWPALVGAAERLLAHGCRLSDSLQ